MGVNLNKSTFNRLELREQIRVFNSILDKGINIKEACLEIGISYSTIRDRFQKGKYKYNKYTNQYEELKDNHIKNEELENTIKNVINRINSEKLEPGLIDNNDDVIVRSFRIRKKVLEDFTDYCENSLLKQYDVLSLFILEGMEKYKKK